MDYFKIKGPCRLNGEIEVSGSKNAALPIMAAALLAPGRTVLKGVPYLSDIRVLGLLLESMGCKVERLENGDLAIDATTIDRPHGDYEIVRQLRAGICILGPLLGRCRQVEVSMPGGCAIGNRPIDIHIRGMRELGANCYLKGGYVIADAPKGLIGAEIFLGGSFGSTVLGTANVLSAAVLAKGTTIIESAACEPEITDLCHMLVKMGAKIKGIGSPRLEIEGVTSLNPVEYEIIPDRIEAGTFMCAAAITEGNLKLKNCRTDHLLALINKLRGIGVTVDKTKDGCEVIRRGRLNPADVTTQPYPGFPTDLQAQLMSVLALADGNSIVVEKIYPQRFMHVAELNRMGANLRKEGDIVVVAGVDRLSGAPLMASDLRASAALVIAGLAAEGETIINRIYHIDRGYEKIEEKLNSAGALIERLKE
ncbi:MAG: UDP-N-acetylglucosamine 1-carboxyvinyltransferase [Sedimentisphaerales bacterium]|nr:UDP-N-acetylglucosamine 1-carboxyvinyltransferase [Sedimentisphaerales bacterium]MBN2842153.1 UDP-N-acetylglucosamine 1-carboxyvinyltransferase [Sedimentisphaerales bacterium]